MKRLVALISLLIALPCCAATKVVFWNGIFGSEKGNLASSARLRTILEEAGYLPAPPAEALEFAQIDSPFDGPIDDVVELYEQARISGKALAAAKLTDSSATIGSAPYRRELGRLYAEGIAQYDLGNEGSAVSRDLQYIYILVNRLSFTLREEILRGNKVVVVAHSQGNYLVEAVDAYLRYRGSTSEARLLDANVRFVGAAPTAASTPNGRYISADEDDALRLHSIETFFVSGFEILPRNVSLCEAPVVSVLYAQCTASIKLSRLDPLIHGFVAIYASDLLDLDTGKTLATLLADLIRKSLLEVTTVLPSAALELTADAGGGAYTLRGSAQQGMALIIPDGLSGNAFSIRPTFSPGGRDPGGPYVEAGNSLAAGAALTISAWIYADSLASEHVIASKYDSNGPGTSWFFTASSAGLRAGVYGEGDEVRTFEPGGVGAIPLATWVHVAFTFNAATQEGRLYVNGNLQASLPQGSPVSSIRQTTTPVRLGVYFASGSYVGPSAFFFGAIDSVRFYTSALGPQEIAALVNAR